MSIVCYATEMRISNRVIKKLSIYFNILLIFLPQLLLKERRKKHAKNYNHRHTTSHIAKHIDKQRNRVDDTSARKFDTSVHLVDKLIENKFFYMKISRVRHGYRLSFLKSSG